MKFVAAIDTTIYGIVYHQGDLIDISKWTRKQELQFLGLGLISGQQFTSADLASVIAITGGTPVVDPVTDKTTITLPVEPIDWLSDVDTSTTPPTNGQTLVYNAVAGLWQPATPAAGGGGGITPDSTWIVPSLLNGWTRYLATEWESVGYRKNADSTVALRGLVKGGSQGSVVFTLPAGYRPPDWVPIYHVHAGGGAMRLDVRVNGDVWADAFYAGGNNAWVSLAGIRFYTT